MIREGMNSRDGMNMPIGALTRAVTASKAVIARNCLPPGRLFRSDVIESEGGGTMSESVFIAGCVAEFNAEVNRGLMTEIFCERVATR
jgi:hypothetical protein